MYAPAFIKQFERDIKLSQRRGKNVQKLKIIIESIISGHPLDAIHGDHKLSGKYVGRRECHIESDWLIVYKISESTVVFERTGTHSDLFV